MPGGGKKAPIVVVDPINGTRVGRVKNVTEAVFPPLHLHDHDHPIRINTNDYDRQKKLLQNRGKSLELKEGLDRTEGPTATGTTTAKSKTGKCQSSGSGSGKSTEGGKVQNGKTEPQKTPTKSEQKALHKLEQQQIKSEQKAQKEQQKLEKEQLKEQLKLEKGLAKSASKAQDRLRSAEHPFASVREYPQLKTQKSVDLSCLKHQKSVEGRKHLARKSVDMQYRQNLLDPTSAADFTSSFSSIQLKPKK